MKVYDRRMIRASEGMRLFDWLDPSVCPFLSAPCRSYFDSSVRSARQLIFAVRNARGRLL